MAYRTTDFKQKLESLPLETVVLKHTPKNAGDAGALIEAILEDINALEDLAKNEPVKLKARMALLRTKATGRKADVDAVVAVLKALAEEGEEPTSKEDRSKPFLNTTIEGAPPPDFILPGVFEMMRNPEGWRIEDSGVYKQAPDGNGGYELRLVLPAPVLVAAESSDADTKQKLLTLAYKDQGRWHCRSFPASSVLHASGTKELTDCGLPLTSNSARPFVNFVEAFRRANHGVIPCHRVVTKIGWFEDTHFIMPHYVVSPHGKTCDAFFERHDGGAALVNKLPVFDKFGGEPEAELRKLWKLGSTFPWLAFGAYVTFASILIRPLKSEEATGCLIDIGGRTSTGKSTMAGFAMSMIGTPIDQVVSWEETNLRIQSIAGLRGNLTLWLEELKRRANRKGLSGIGGAKDLVYALNDGYARAGMTSDIRFNSRSTWALDTFSTNETPLTQMARGAGGLRARSIPVTTNITGIDSTETAEMLDELGRLQNGPAAGYGMFAFLHAVIPRLADEAWRTQTLRKFRKALSFYYSESHCNEARRVSNHLARIETAAWLLHNAVIGTDGLPLFAEPTCGHAAVISKMIGALHRVSETANEAENQIWALGQWLQASPSKVLGLGGDYLPPVIYAVWPRGGEAHILITEAGLKAFMLQSSSGLDEQALVNDFGAKEVLMAPTDPGQLKALQQSEGNWYRNARMIGRYHYTLPDGSSGAVTLTGWRVSWHKVRGLLDLNVRPTDGQGVADLSRAVMSEI